jgi:predicted Fe-Mo cluster-binding NifX family protein
MEKLVVAIPKFEGNVAPCFEAARKMLIGTLESGQVVSSEIVTCGGCEGFRLVRILRERKVDMVICDGIKGFYRDLLQASGIDVVSNVALPVGEALALAAGGELEIEETEPALEEMGPDIPREDLVCWTRELFESNGYRITPGAERAPFPIDLVAEIDCPICGKPVRVAISCGAHAYRVEQELQELRRVSASDYHAQVYVRPGNEKISRCCRDYGIELVDPSSDTGVTRPPHGKRIPLLRGPVIGHERATQSRGRR